MRTLIKNATIVNEGKILINGAIVIVDDIIDGIYTNLTELAESFDEVIDAEGCYVLPGIIDEHVHFREPGMTQKADIESETRAAAAGGVTSYFEMPNTNPQTTTIQAMEDKYALAATKSHVNYAFFIGATNDNIDELLKVDPHTVPGVKVFMGSSTGNMLVDQENALEEIFSKVKLPIMTHCENTDIINKNLAKVKELYGDDPDVKYHPVVRDRNACLSSTIKAIKIAAKYNTRLHIAHLSTALECTMLITDDGEVGFRYPNITGEVCVGHLLFSEEDYKTKGTLIKVNPAIKTKINKELLLRITAQKDKQLKDVIVTVATDHAPHLLSDKQGGCVQAASGMPMIQFSLPAMMEFVEKGELPIERLVELMCHNPAQIFSVDQRGYLRKGYKADITLIKRKLWVVTKKRILSKCGWSPLEGKMLHWQVVRTICNGHTVYQDGKVDTDYIGERITFRH